MSIFSFSHKPFPRINFIPLVTSFYLQICPIGICYLVKNTHILYIINACIEQLHRGYLFFSVKDRNLFHRVDTIGNIFTSGTATSENITDGVHKMK